MFAFLAFSGFYEYLRSLHMVPQQYFNILLVLLAVTLFATGLASLYLWVENVENASPRMQHRMRRTRKSMRVILRVVVFLLGPLLPIVAVVAGVVAVGVCTWGLLTGD